MISQLFLYLQKNKNLKKTTLFHISVSQYIVHFLSFFVPLRNGTIYVTNKDHNILIEEMIEAQK